MQPVVNPDEQHRPPQTRRRLLLRLLFAMIVAFAAVAAYVLLSPSQLDQQIAELRSRGLPTNAAELNAYYAVPSDVADTTQLWTAATTAIRNARIDQRAKALPVVGTGPTPIPDPGQEWTKLAESQAFLEELDDEMRLVRKAAEARGMARYPIDFRNGFDTLLSDTQETRTLARLLTLSAHVNAHEGKINEVLNDVAGIFAVSDSVRGEPLLISQLVRMAIHAIGCELAADMLPLCHWTDAELATLQLAIARADFRAEMLRAIHGERAICLHTLDTTFAFFLLRVTNKSKALEFFGDATEGLDSSWQEATRQCENLDKEMKVISGGGISRLRYMSVMWLTPGLRQAVNAGTRAEARQNCMITMIAVYRYRLQHGNLQASLAELKKFIPGDDAAKNQRPTDPFDGQPLRFKSDSSQVTIYSIGDNRVDDGGVISSEKPHEGDLGYSVQH